MKKTILISLVFLGSFSGLSQNKIIDSLKKELSSPILKDTTKIRLYTHLANSYTHISTDSVGKYSHLALKLANSSTDYFLGRAQFERGQYYSHIGQMDSARYYLKRAVDIGEKMQDTSLLISSYSGYKWALNPLTDFEEKVRLGLLLIELTKNDQFLLAQEQFNLAVSYSNGGQQELAMKYLGFSTKNAEESGHENLLSYTLSTLIYYSLEENDLEKAKFYLDKSLKLCEKLDSPRICNKYYARAGLYYDKIGAFDKAENAFDNALITSKELNDSYDIMTSYVDLGEHFLRAGKPKKAIDNFKKFEIIHTDYPEPDLVIKAYEKWAKASKMIGDYQNSNKYLEKYIAINDSLNSEKNKTTIANAETKYQTEKKDKEIITQSLALEKSKSKSQIMTILIVALLLASLLLWFIFQQRQKRIQQQLITIQKEQEVLTLESLIAGEEKERLRIAQELHDGVNGDLSAIKFKLSSLLKMNNEVINEAVSMIDNSCQQVRAISHNLVPPSLQDFKLQEAIANYCENMDNSNKPAISFQHIGATLDFNKKAEVNILRIVQELVTNAIKHAQASEITVQTSLQEGTMQLSVEDNGVGYDVNLENSNGIGLQNIKSRVAYLDGDIDVVSNKKGTEYTITFNPDNAS